MAYGYLLDGNKRILKGVYSHSQPKLNFDLNSGKIATLLILSEKVRNIAFDIDDKKFYEEMVKIFYSSGELKIEDMKKDSSEILKEQSIIAGVSNWEGYFQEISEIILNDTNFIQKLSENKKYKTGFRTFLKEFQIMQDFSTEVLLNGNRMDGLQFGTYIRNKQKNYFQKTKNISFFLTLCDINIKKLIEETDWEEVPTFISTRHEIVHNPNNTRVIKNYSKDKIEHVLKNMSNLIGILDKILFTNDQPSVGDFMLS